MKSRIVQDAGIADHICTLFLLKLHGDRMVFGQVLKSTGKVGDPNIILPNYNWLCQRISYTTNDSLFTDNYIIVDHP